MKFNERQSSLIGEFILRYNSDEKFKKIVQELYDSEISQLSILYIYALEEILRYGTKGIFNKFLAIRKPYTYEEAVDLFDAFIKLLNQSPDFKKHKIDQLKNQLETLTAMEVLAFSLINESHSKNVQMFKEKTIEPRYDSLNQILYSTDEEIKETLENLFFGEIILQMLDLPAMQDIKARQKDNGIIANVDKPVIIGKVRSIFSTKDSLSEFKQVIDKRYIKVKMDLLSEKGKESFSEYLNFNTNISADEILGRKKQPKEDMYASFMDIIKKEKEQDKNESKK